MGLRKLGAGCPTGPAMPPGRWLGLGGTCAPAYASSLQRMLPICGQPKRSRGHFPGSVSSRVPDAGKLSFRAWGLCDLDDQRDQEFVDRSLPEDEARSHHRFPGRCHARGREQGIFRAASGRAGAAGRIERAGAGGADEAFAGTAGSGNFAGPATTGVCGDSRSIERAGRNSEVTDQSGKDRVGTDPATNGSEAVMKTGYGIKSLVFAGVEMEVSLGVEP
jgi:hypothetical protein